jgi:hypothetical protein
MNTTCSQAKSQLSKKLKSSSFSGRHGEQQKAADQPEMPTPGGDATAHTDVLLTGGG